MRCNRASGALGAIVLVIAALGAQPSVAARGGASRAASAGRAAAVDPLSGWRIFRSENTPAAADAASYRRHGSTHDAELMERISSQPIATWLTDDAIRARREVTALTADATRHRSAAVLVVYDIPGRNCDEGVGAGTHAYLGWVAEIAAGIEQRDTVVILEPDAIPFAIGGCPIEFQLLAEAVKELARASGARVYVDAGNPSWVTPVSLLAAPLRAADVAQAAGFSLNVSNFETNAANIAYGHELSRLLGGAHFVIDTSRNGNGPALDAAGAPIICDPPGRGLGAPPSTSTGVSGLDAYLWIKPPGSSDGSCRPGAPRPGAWWPYYALELAADAPFLGLG